MLFASIISIAVTIICLVLSLAFKVAGKLRLTLPLLYFLGAAISTIFTNWTNEHESLVLYGLYVLLALVAISWVVSLAKAISRKHSERRYYNALESDIVWQLKRARELGIPTNNTRVLQNGTVVHAETGEPILPQRI